MRKFDPSDIIWTPLVRCGEVEAGPAGLMADYCISASWNGVTKDMAFKVLHDVMNPNEPDPFMYDMALGMATKALVDILRKEANQMERDELLHKMSDGALPVDGIKMEDIKFSQLIENKDHVYIIGEFLGQRMSAHSELKAFKDAAANGYTERMVEEMKFSILHSFRTTYDRLVGGLTSPSKES